MKKLIFVLAIFIAAPAFAALVVECNNVDPGTKLAIQYKGADAGNLPRAFALDLTIDMGGSFTDIDGYIQGESNSTTKGYGIYPATIQFVDNDVNDWGSPLCPVGAPGTTDQDLSDGSSHIVLEFASLYLDPNAPPTSGTLCYVYYSCSAEANVVMTDEDTYRGGLVLEDGTAGEVSNSIKVCEVTECYAGRPDYAEWQDAKSPTCWCFQRQCHGDADGLKQGDTKNGYYYVGSNDLTVLTGAWKIKNSPKGPGLSGSQGCADFDHLKQGDTKNGYYRVGSNDLTVLTTYWKIKESPKGPGVSGNCLPGNVIP